MQKQRATWEDLWNLTDEDLEELLGAEEPLIELPQETQRVDSSVLERAMSQSPLEPTR